MGVRRDRTARALSGIDTSRGRGLEVGPLYSPLVSRAEADVCYLDVDDGPALRAHYASHPGVPHERIVDVDVTLTHEGRVRGLAEALAPHGRFDWAVASHVVEHVPDLVQWLADLATVLHDEGRLALVVPDRRFSFDARRPPTTVGQALHAHRLGDTRPSLRAVFDHHHAAVTVAPADAWRGHLPGPEGRVHDMGHVLEQVDRQQARGEYVDCHVWVFTPEEFVDTLAVLAGLGLCDFVVQALDPTDVGDLEFFVTLRRLPRSLGAAERAEALAHGFPPVGAGTARPGGAGLHLVTDREMSLVRAKRRAVRAYGVLRGWSRRRRG